MKNRPIHQNLDTSYVNLSALIKYLRRRQFLGSVKVQLNGYKADINLQEDNLMDVREHDQISGRISRGEEALQRILIRAREPGGTIDVYQIIKDDSETTATEEAANEETAAKVETAEIEIEPTFAVAKIEVEPTLAENKIIKEISETVLEKSTVNKNSRNGNSAIKTIKRNLIKPEPEHFQKPLEQIQTFEKPKPNLPDFPFSLTNKVEDKARSNQISTEDWQTLLKLTVELLTVVDKSLAQAKLNFTAAFGKSRMEIAEDYPFLNPELNIFDYKNGKIKMTEQINSNVFTISIMEALRRILEKLSDNPKFTEVHRRTVQNIIALMNKRKTHYDKFSITAKLERILGI